MKKINKFGIGQNVFAVSVNGFSPQIVEGRVISVYIVPVRRKQNIIYDYASPCGYKIERYHERFPETSVFLSRAAAQKRLKFLNKNPYV